jgi:gamma-glutamylcysteine synthetase
MTLKKDSIHKFYKTSRKFHGNFLEKLAQACLKASRIGFKDRLQEYLDKALCVYLDYSV